MKISVDGGALCGDKKYGNYVVSANLIAALKKYDKKTDYAVYSFCDKKGTKNLKPKIFWSRLRVSLEEFYQKTDYYFALNQALPWQTPAEIIAFSHGLSFHFFRKLYPDSHLKIEKELDDMCRRAKYIVVSSIKVKNELQSIKRLNENKIKVIPYGVPLDMISQIKDRRSKIPYGVNKNKFFLAVGMDHPIKNHKILPRDKYKFIVATGVSRVKLKSLYQKATALVTTSLYESFNLPVLEALALGCPVIGLKSAIIPELAPHVNLCEDEKELVQLLDMGVQGKLKTPDVKKIRQEFSWKNYVNNLVKIIKE